MVRGSYMKILMHEGDRQHWFGHLAYQDLVQHLWKDGVPGLTVFRADEGLDPKGHIQSIESEYASENLPLTLEVYASSEEVTRISNGLGDNLPRHARIWTINDVIDAKHSMKEDLPMSNGAVLKVYMKEDDIYESQPLYHALLIALRHLNTDWVSVQKALEGFGADHVIRKALVFGLAEQSPVVVEVALKDDEVSGVLEKIQPLLQCASGPAILLPGNVVEIKS